MKLAELAARLGCELRGDGQVEVHRVAPIERAGPGELSFVANSKYRAQAGYSRAAALIVAPGLELGTPLLVCDNPYLAFARAVALLHPSARPAAGVHPTAVVAATAVLGPEVHVGPHAVVGARVRLGARSVLHAHVVLYDDVEVGPDCLLHAGVHVREGCRLGARVVVQNGAVIGADGFGFARNAEGRYEKIPQVGSVVIEDDVEIGALSAVDRAALHETRLGRGCKLDNLVQIGHSVTLGHDTVLAGQVGIAGSTRVGAGVTLAGQVGVGGHLSIGDGVVATGKAGITASVEPGTMISGHPAQPHREWLRSAALVTRLPELQRRLRVVEERLQRLTGDDRSSG